MQPPVSVARARFRRVLVALRLFERGGYALGPLAWTRTHSGPWRPVPFGGSGRPRLLTLVRGDQEDELRAFINLVTRRQPASGDDLVPKHGHVWPRLSARDGLTQRAGLRNRR